MFSHEHKFSTAPTKPTDLQILQMCHPEEEEMEEETLSLATEAPSRSLKIIFSNN